MCGATASAIARIASAGHQHDRPLRTAEQPGGWVIDVGDGGRGRQVGHHHGERLVPAPLSLSQFGDRLLVVGVAGQVVSADALDRENATVAQQPSCLQQCIVAVGHATVAVAVAQRRSAVRAAHGLGMEPPVGGVGVFAGAIGAHREGRHGGGGTVVWQGGDDGEARAAVGAVDERVAVAPVGRIALFGGTVRAHGDVGGGQRAATVGPRRVGDGETGATDDRDIVRLNRFDDSQRRRSVTQPCQEMVDFGGIALHLDDGAGGVVAHRAGQPEGGRRCVDERSESHALDHPAHADT